MSYPIEALDFQKDFPEFSRLFKVIYDGKEPCRSMYEWLFVKNVFNREGHFLHVAKDGAKVVASDCLLPVPVIINGNQYNAAWSIRTMTDPEYQRRGIFRALTNHNIEAARRQGIDLILGFANNNSYPGYVKFGWEVLFERTASYRPLNLEKALTKKLRLPGLAKLANEGYRRYDHRKLQANSHRHTGWFRFTNSTQAPPETDSLWAKMHNFAPIMVARHHKYCDWRYNQRPNHKYKFITAYQGAEPAGLLIWRMLKNGSALLVDYVGPRSKDLIVALANQALIQARNNGANLMLESTGPYFRAELKTLGFRDLGRPLQNNHFIALRLNEKLDSKILGSEENWFFSYGDSEFDLDAGF
ncbi:MAG: GNAT family N-acetyltransferase [Firmicutes bacterium]|nr:GNAT family N-acetyltransferase [Bacillota bacterium]